MSYLSLPRIGFAGNNVHVSVSTANNNNVLDLLDYDQVELRNKMGLSPTEYQQWLMGVVNVGDEEKPNLTLRGYWNYYGDHSTHWGPAHVNGIWDRGMSEPAAGVILDPLAGAQVNINARIVDLDPADTFSTIFIASVFQVIGRDAQGQPVTLLSGRNPTPHCTYFLNFKRPAGGGVFQFVIPNERITWCDPGFSPAMDALRAEASQGGGILVRYALYALNVKNRYDAKTMAEKFQQGEFVQNIKTGPIVGSIGVWDGQDFQTGPVGRLLYLPSSPYCHTDPPVGHVGAIRPRPKSHGDVERLWERAQEGDMLLEGAAPESSLYPAIARVDHERKVVTLDLLSTVPEDQQEWRSGRYAKINLGDISLCVRYRDPYGKEQIARIGSIAYDYATYITQNGLVEVSYAHQPELEKFMQTGSLFISRDNRPNEPLLREIVVPQVMTEQRCAYFDQGQPGTITLQVFDRGEPVAHPVTVGLELWQDLNTPSTEDNTTDPPTVRASQFYFRQINEDDPAYALPGSTITVPAGGKVELHINPRAAGCYKIRFRPNNMEIPTSSDGPDWTTEFFSLFRVLPDEDFSHHTDAEINSWSFIYDKVFNYYAQLYPVMNRIIPWGPGEDADDQDRVRMFAALIYQAIDVENLGSTMAMPITRELSAGKRALLQRWCRLQLYPEEASQ